MNTGCPAVAIVLARAGSRGVPGKNVAVVAGRPCLAWTLAAARDAQRVGTVAVSTDDPRAARIARDLGAVVVERPARLATDEATVSDAARHALDELVATGQASPAEDLPVVILYASVPVRPPGLIDRAVDMFLATGCDSVQSYTPVGKHHPWWMVRVDAHGRVRPWEGEVVNGGVHRRQDLPAAYVPDGGVLVVRAGLLRRAGSQAASGPHAFLGRDRRGLVTRIGEVVDIDTPLDLLVAEAVLREQAGR